MEALLEAEVARPGQFANEITTAFAGVEKFFSAEYNAYTAWVYFPGNSDIYYGSPSSFQLYSPPGS